MRKLCVYACLWIGAYVAQAQPHINIDKNGLAIEGYDPVAYFTEHLPLEGRAELAYVHKGATYYFASSENREMFIENPAQYLPQYGGWCAYAIGKSSKKVDITPNSFRVKDNKLYLFYKTSSYDALDKWSKQEELGSVADKNWEKITVKK